MSFFIIFHWNQLTGNQEGQLYLSRFQCIVFIKIRVRYRMFYCIFFSGPRAPMRPNSITATTALIQIHICKIAIISSDLKNIFHTYRIHSTSKIMLSYCMWWSIKVICCASKIYQIRYRSRQYPRYFIKLIAYKSTRFLFTSIHFKEKRQICRL